MTLTPSFRMPEGYRRMFKLRGEGFEFTMEFIGPDKFEYYEWHEDGLPCAIEFGLALDWMQKSMAAVRREVGA